MFLQNYKELQDNQSMKSDQQIREIIKDTKKKMMFTLIIGFFATILLGFIVPGKIALPFKKIKDALRELQECNFDVSIFYNQDDEIGEIAREMNKMIHSFKTFEELRMNRISLKIGSLMLLQIWVKSQFLSLMLTAKSFI